MEQEQFYIFVEFKESYADNRERAGYVNHNFFIQKVATTVRYEDHRPVKYHRIPVDFDPLDHKEVYVCIMTSEAMPKREGDYKINDLKTCIAAFLSEEAANKFSEYIKNGGYADYIKAKEKFHGIEVSKHSF